MLIERPAFPTRASRALVREMPHPAIGATDCCELGDGADVQRIYRGEHDRRIHGQDRFGLNTCAASASRRPSLGGGARVDRARRGVPHEQGPRQPRWQARSTSRQQPVLRFELVGPRKATITAHAGARVALVRRPRTMWRTFDRPLQRCQLGTQRCLLGRTRRRWFDRTHRGALHDADVATAPDS